MIIETRIELERQLKDLERQDRELDRSTEVVLIDGKDYTVPRRGAIAGLYRIRLRILDVQLKLKELPQKV